MPEIREVATLMKFEGFTIEEANLTYAERQKLPANAFSGPDKTYPSHDAKCVRKSFSRLSKFGKEIPKSIAIRIYHNLITRAKKFNVKHNPHEFKWLTGVRTVEEVFDEMEKREEELLAWLDEIYGFNKNKKSKRGDN